MILKPAVVNAFLILLMCSKLRVSRSMRIQQPVTPVFAFVRSWCTPITLPPSSAMIFETCTNWPGLSRSSTLRSAERPDVKRPRLITRSRIFTSMLPPDTTQITFLPSTGILSNITAATATAPAPSVMIFWCSSIERIADETSSSLTVTMPSTYLLQKLNVFSPGCFTAIPSAIVETESRRSI